MALSRRQKLLTALLAFYWPAIFILSHIPVPRLIQKMHVSDKALHYLGYFILVFLLWFAISPDRKVSWHRGAAWLILLVVVWYGAIDEWLQSYVGRSSDVKDFIADLAGAATGLILLSIFAFWSACLITTGSVIFILTNFSNTDLALVLPVTSTVFYLLAYGLFTLLWLRYMHYFLPVRVPEGKWLVGAFAVPMGLLLVTEVFSLIVIGSFELSQVLVSAAGACVVIVLVFLVSVLQKRFAQGLTSARS